MNKLLTKQLYTANEVKEVRIKLLAEQENKDLITGMPLLLKVSVTDHDHEAQFVRGILHRQVNSFVGKLENNYKRMIGWWCNIPLPELLRLIAAYLELPPDKRYLHPGWIKYCKIQFNKLSESEKSKTLIRLDVQDGKNSKERKELFNKALLSRKYEYHKVLEIINQTKGTP